jgi:hypothetical protein
MYERFINYSVIMVLLTRDTGPKNVQYIAKRRKMTMFHNGRHSEFIFLPWLTRRKNSTYLGRSRNPIAWPVYHLSSNLRRKDIRIISATKHWGSWYQRKIKYCLGSQSSAPGDRASVLAVIFNTESVVPLQQWWHLFRASSDRVP